MFSKAFHGKPSAPSYLSSPNNIPVSSRDTQNSQTAFKWDAALNQAQLTRVDLVLFRSLPIVITHLQPEAANVT